VTRFSEEWLAMREPLDAAAREATLAERLSDLVLDTATCRCLDLGCGTGANLRYLAPLIPVAQEWVLLDSDEHHLEQARALAASTRGSVPAELSVVTRRVDLAQNLDVLCLEKVSVVTASALLDLVSSAWLTRLLQRCCAHKVIVLFALSYDGRIDLTPCEPDDEAVRNLVNRHQRTDKGFGPALGPAATGCARTCLEEQHYQVESAPSDWVLGPSHARVQECLLRGWVQAAMEVAPWEQARCERWLRRRLGYLEQGLSLMRVGHQDLMGWPAAAQRIFR
jgi:SAM-dependent methyltransferase